MQKLGTVSKDAIWSCKIIKTDTYVMVPAVICRPFLLLLLSFHFKWFISTVAAVLTFAPERDLGLEFLVAGSNTHLHFMCNYCSALKPGSHSHLLPNCTTLFSCSAASPPQKDNFWVLDNIYIGDCNSALLCQPASLSQPYPSHATV